MSPRRTVAALAPPRSAWSAAVERWSQAAALPFTVIRCVSADDLRRRADDDGATIALIDEHGLLADPTLVADLTRRGHPVVVIVNGDRTTEEWGADPRVDVLHAPFTRDELIGCLEHECAVIDESDGSGAIAPQSRGTLIAVTGSGGSGTSTMARALAGALVAKGEVALVDAAPHADQALLHDLGDVVPGLPELAELHRRSHPTRDEVVDLLWSCPRHGYDLLPGLRRPREWTLLRRRSVDSMFESLLGAYDVVVVDCDHDLDGERETGSLDIEERNVLARATLDAADAVVITTRSGLAPLRRCVTITSRIVDAGVDVERIVVTVVDAPRSTPRRSRLGRDLALLLRSEVGPTLGRPVMIQGRRELDAIDLDGAPIPSNFTASTVTALDHISSIRGSRRATTSPLHRIVPGTLGLSA